MWSLGGATRTGARARIETAPYRPVQIGSNPGKIAAASSNQRRRIIGTPVTATGGLRATVSTGGRFVVIRTYKDTTRSGDRGDSTVAKGQAGNYESALLNMVIRHDKQ